MKPINKILRKMSQAVGVDWKEVDFFGRDYFWDHSWTIEQEQEFTDWLADLLYEDKEARNVIMKYPRKNKKSCRDVAKFFVWNHGWKTEPPN